MMKYKTLPVGYYLIPQPEESQDALLHIRAVATQGSDEYFALIDSVSGPEFLVIEFDNVDRLLSFYLGDDNMCKDSDYESNKCPACIKSCGNSWCSFSNGNRET